MENDTSATTLIIIFAIIFVQKLIFGDSNSVGVIGEKLTKGRLQLSTLLGEEDYFFIISIFQKIVEKKVGLLNQKEEVLN